MMRSMYSGVSGLKVHQTKMDVIGNNIANVNTNGFKSQRVTFSEVFSQTISGATGASDDTGRGGVNPMQVGLGVSVASIDNLMTQGAAQRTDNPFDIMISGDGFIIAGDASGRYFTRAGALRQDEQGNLVIPNGMKVQGWMAQENPATNKYEIKPGVVEDINLGRADIQTATPVASKSANITGNLCSTDDTAMSSVSFYDSLGNYYTVPIQFEKVKTGNPPVPQPNQWTISVAQTDNQYIMRDSKGNAIDLGADLFTGATIEFDPATGKISAANGNVSQDPNAPLGTFELTFDSTVTDQTGSAIGQQGIISLDLSNLTQFTTKKSDLTATTTSGREAGTLQGFSVGNDGIITASYSNGELRPVAQIPLAAFSNPAGLEKAGDNLFVASTNSGEFDGIGEAGTFNTGVLEMSNVDLSQEFTDMITTQRGFQANSRIISVSDEMLQELTNLKR